MKLIDVLCSDELSLSFEVFPPKTDTAFESVKSAAEERDRAAETVFYKRYLWRGRRNEQVHA